MTDLQKLNRDKENILSRIRIRGPSLPVQLSKSINLSPLFASAFLAELYAEKKIKMSNIRVGSSPLYYLDGQEPLLENFIQHLNRREQEAFTLLKSKKILSDEDQTPIIRVALRAIKDFAIPVKVRIKEDLKIFWKYFTLPNSELKSSIQEALNPSSKELPKPIKEEPSPKEKEETPQPIPEEIPVKKELPKPIKEEPSPPEETSIKNEEEPAPVEKEVPRQSKPETKLPEQVKQEVPKPVKEEPSPPEEIRANITKPKKKPKVQNHEFPRNIKEYLEAKDIELLESISEKKKEFISKIRIDTLFGKQEFFLMAKDKKKINENDLTLALQKAQAEKMIALVLSKGEIDKKAKEYLKEWKNLIKFEKLNF